MTRDDFFARFRGRMLLFVTDAWSVRRVAPSDLGMVMDQHSAEAKRLLGEMYDLLVTEAKPHATNGHAPNGAATTPKRN